MATTSNRGGGVSAGLFGSGFGVGEGLQAAGILSSAIGSYYQARIAKITEKNRANELEFNAAMARINATTAEVERQSILDAGQKEYSQSTMRTAARREGARAQLASRGVDIGFGSASDLIAANDIAGEIDALTINSNTAKRAAAARMGVTNAANEASLLSVSASNQAASARTLNPFASGFNSLLDGATQFAASWYSRDRNRR